MKRVLFFVTAIFSLSALCQNFTDLKILLVDSDDGKTFLNPDNNSKSIGYEYNFFKAFEMLGFDTLSGNLKRGKLPLVFNEFKQYAAIFIVFGHSTVDATDLSLSDIDNLEGYLESGGCLYIEGNNAISHIQGLDSLFLFLYFNNSCLSDGGALFSGIDTIVSDTTDTLDPFFRLYKFVYPANTKPDSSVDVIGPRDPGLLKIYYKNLLKYDDQTKLYKSVSSSYTPPETKVFHFNGRTIMQSVAFGAFSDPQNDDDRLDDSLENQLVRASYLRDILKFFGIGKTLLVKDDMGESGSDTIIRASLDSLKIDYDIIPVASKADGPGYKTLSEYSAVIWYTGDADTSFTLTKQDTFNLGVFLSYGGNLILSGENIATDIGFPDTNYKLENPFLAKNFGMDFIGKNKTLTSSFRAFASSDSVLNPYYENGYTRICSLQSSSKPDLIFPTNLRGTHVYPTYYFHTLFKGDNMVSLFYEGENKRTIFFGFPIEDILAGMLDSTLKVSYEDIFDINLDFKPIDSLRWLNTQKDFLKFRQKEKTSSPMIFLWQKSLFLLGACEADVIDPAGRFMMKIYEGENSIEKLSRGIFFVKGKSFAKKISIL